MKTKKPLNNQGFLQRRRDSNPRYLTVRWFSRPVHSTTLPLLCVNRSANVAVLIFFAIEKREKIILPPTYDVFAYLLLTEWRGVHSRLFHNKPVEWQK